MKRGKEGREEVEKLRKEEKKRTKEDSAEEQDPQPPPNPLSTQPQVQRTAPDHRGRWAWQMGVRARPLGRRNPAGAQESPRE